MHYAHLLILCLALASAALAHDSNYGFMHCYGGKHCPQDTLVFGDVIAQDANGYTVHIQKVLRGRATEGASVRIRRKAESGTAGATLSVGDGVAVSYRRFGLGAKRPCHLIRSTSPNWNTAEVEGAQHSGDAASIQQFIRSGGVDDEYFFVGSSAFLVRSGQAPVMIYPRNDLPAVPPAAPASAPAAPPWHRAGLVAVSLLAFGALAVFAWARRKATSPSP